MEHILGKSMQKFHLILTATRHHPPGVFYFTDEGVETWKSRVLPSDHPIELPVEGQRRA